MHLTGVNIEGEKEAKGWKWKLEEEEDRILTAILVKTRET